MGAASGLKRLPSVGSLGDMLSLPANRPHELPHSNHRSLHAAYTHVEKLGMMMRVPRPLEATCAARGFDDHTTGFVDYKVSGRVRPVQAVAKFAKESSVLKTCLVSLVRVLYASRSFLFSQPQKCAQGSRGGNVVTKMLLSCLDGTPPTSEVPVDSASLELILAKAIRKAASQEDEEAASQAHSSASPLAVIANAPVDDHESSHTAKNGFGYECYGRHVGDLGVCNEIAYIVAFGCDSSTSNSERESHFADGFLGRCGSMTRNTACIDLAELGARQPGVLASSM